MQTHLSWVMQSQFGPVSIYYLGLSITLISYLASRASLYSFAWCKAWANKPQAHAACFQSQLPFVCIMLPEAECWEPALITRVMSSGVTPGCSKHHVFLLCCTCGNKPACNLQKQGCKWRGIVLQALLAFPSFLWWWWWWSWSVCYTWGWGCSSLGWLLSLISSSLARCSDNCDMFS